MKYSLLLSLAFTTALLASTTSAGAIFSKSNPPAPIETAPIETADIEILHFDRSRRPYIAYLKDETFEALISGNEILISEYCGILKPKPEKFTKNHWTEDEIQKETENREKEKITKTRNDIYSKCLAEAGQGGEFEFIDKQIEVESEDSFFKMTKRSISEGHEYLLRALLKRGKSKISPENYLELIKEALDCGYYNRKKRITETVLEHIDISTVNLEDVIILALENKYTRNKETVDMLLAKKGPDFTGGKILLAIARQYDQPDPQKPFIIKDNRYLSGASVKLRREEYDKDTYYDNRPAFMVRLLNEGDINTKYEDYAALEHLIGKSKSKHLRYFLKAGKVDLSDVAAKFLEAAKVDLSDVAAKVKDAEEKLDYLSRLVAEEPPAEYWDNYLYSSLDDEHGLKDRYTGTNKWEMQYYAGAGAEAK